MNPAPADKPMNPIPPAPRPEMTAPPAPDVPQPTAQPAARSAPGTAAGRVFLAVTATLFLGWLGWLSYAALTKSREPIVSRSQAAVAVAPVVATVTADEKGVPSVVVTVVEPLRPHGPLANSKLVVTNLAAARGFAGPGEYLLLLGPDHTAIQPDGGPVFQVYGSRGTATESDPPTIYPWSPGVAAQAKRMYREKE